jgi:hypothetical protein
MQPSTPKSGFHAREDVREDVRSLALITAKTGGINLGKRPLARFKAKTGGITLAQTASRPF